MMKRIEIVNELKNNFSDEELFELADESKKSVIEEDSFLRKIAKRFYVEDGDDGDNVMNMTVQIPIIVLEILVERFKVLKNL